MTENTPEQIPNDATEPETSDRPRREGGPAPDDKRQTREQPTEAWESIRAEIREQVQEATDRFGEQTLEALRVELEHVQEKARRSALQELVRQEQAGPRGLHKEAREALLRLYTARIESVRREAQILVREQRRVFRSKDPSLRERLAEIDYVRSRLVEMENEVAQVEESATGRLAGSGESHREEHLVEGAARPDLSPRSSGTGQVPLRSFDDRLSSQEETIAGLIRGLEHQKNALAELRAGLPGTRLSRLDLAGRFGWLIPLLALLLVVGVAIAGILLPRRVADARASPLVDIAALYSAVGDKASAVLALDRAVQVGIKETESLAQTGQLYHELGEYESAVQVLRKAVEEAPRDEEILLAFAQSLSEAEQHDEAIVQYKELVARDPSDIWRLARLGHEYRRMGEYAEALEQYQGMREILPDQWWTDYYQGLVYRDQGDLEQAIARLGEAVQTNPDYYWSRLELGLSYIDNRDHVLAEEHLRAAIELNPGHPEAPYRLGQAFLDQGRFEEAVEPLQQALELEPNWVEARLGLGTALLNLGDCTGARRQFRLVLADDEQNARAQEGMTACPGE